MKDNTVDQVTTIDIADELVLTNWCAEPANAFDRHARYITFGLGCCKGYESFSRDELIERVHVTRFPNQSAQSKTELQLTLAELGELIRTTNASSKEGLPWLKLATFGTQRTGKNCLRSNANVVAISGIEADYDAGVTNFEQACNIARHARLSALIYTSASYTDKAPRWRILLPTSKRLPPSERDKLMARLQGVYGGAFSPESFTLSQSYYFGSVDHNPAHQVQVVEGDFIDLRADLDRGAIGKKRDTSKPSDTDRKAELEAPIQDVIRELEAIPNDDHPNHDRAYWVRVGMAVKGATGGSAEGADAFANWSEKHPSFDPDTTATLWESLHPNNIGFGTLRRLADEARAKPGIDITTEFVIKPKASADDKPKTASRLMQTSREFVRNYVPPDYLIDGLLQRRYVYSFTGPTGSGKTALTLLIAAHVAKGEPLAGREVERGRVLFFAGENPDDVRSRWIKLCEVLGEDPDSMDVVFMPFTPNLSEKEIRAQIDAEAAEHGPFSLLIVDTSAAYYTGNDENDNVALGNHARLLRTFVKLPGGPTVLVTCHPTKTPNMESLLPRGGGAFLAEVDGNLVCIIDRTSMTVEVTTHGKFRGPEFAPFSFKVLPGKSPKLIDSKGRQTWTVYASPISDADVEMLKKSGGTDQDALLRAMLDEPGKSFTELADHLCWLTITGGLNKTKVHRIMKELAKAKLVELRRDGHYILTSKGTTEAEQTPRSPIKVAFKTVPEVP